MKLKNNIYMIRLKYLKYKYFFSFIELVMIINVLLIYNNIWVLFNNHFLVICIFKWKKYNKSKTIPMIYTLRLLD